MPTRPEAGGPDGEEGDAPPSRPVRPSLSDRVRSAIQPTADPARSPRSSRRAVERLDDRERRICFAASGLAVLTGVLIYAVEKSNHFHPVKGELSPQTTLVIGVVTGALLAVATLIGRRAPVGFVSLFVFLAFGTQYFSGIPFLVLAVWLLYRSYKYQKEAAANRRAAAAERPSSSGRGGAARSGRAGPAPKAAPRSSKKPTGPEANKRYTPKRPLPPPPKPSRRERKAAQASE